MNDHSQSNPNSSRFGNLGAGIFTVPNLISLLRLASIPVFLWLLFSLEERFAAALLWGSVGATDWLDGWWARTFDAESELGKILDPLTDRFVLIVGIAAVGVDGAVPWIIVVLTLSREVLVSLGGVALAILGAARIDVTWWGKCATFGLYFAFPLLLAGASEVGVASWFWWIGWICLLPSLGYSYLSALQYFPLGVAALRSGREDKKD